MIRNAIYLFNGNGSFRQRVGDQLVGLGFHSRPPYIDKNGSFIDEGYQDRPDKEITKIHFKNYSGFRVYCVTTKDHHAYQFPAERCASELVEVDQGKKYNLIAYKDPKNKGVTLFWWRDGRNLYTHSESYNSDPKQQWTDKQIVDFGLEGCKKIEVKPNEARD